MKKIIFIIITFILFIPSIHGLDLETYSKNVLLYNATDDMYLYEKNSEEKTPIASLTKIMTYLVAEDYITNLDEKVVMTKDDFEGLIEKNASVAGFKENQIVTYRDLLYGLMLPSGADAALSLVHNTYQTEENFINKMNDMASIIGLENTSFTTVTGLDTEGNYSTLKDLLKLLKYALNNENFKNSFSAVTYKTSDNSLEFKSMRYFINEKHNFNYVTGAKSGTTDDAGLCLISTATFNNVDFILITTQAPKNYSVSYNIFDAINIYNYFFENYDYVTVFHINDIVATLETVNSKEKFVDIRVDHDVKIYMDKSTDLSNIKYNYEGLKKLSYKNKLGDKIGNLSVFYGEQSLDNVDLFLTTQIHFDYKLILSPALLILLILSLVFIIKKIVEKSLRIS